MSNQHSEFKKTTTSCFVYACLTGHIYIMIMQKSPISRRFQNAYFRSYQAKGIAPLNLEHQNWLNKQAMAVFWP